ncbi:MAG: hypothetical protein BUE48_008865 [Thermomonospora sp. CIF 1]|nr:MAG: hypothetical protein BUE48_008865 [Thermomonospora sp. CIF 1]
MGAMSGANPLPRAGEVFFDARGEDRALRLSWHPDAQVMVISIWNGGVCSGTFRLSARDIPAFMESLSQGMPAPQPRGRRHASAEARPDASGGPQRRQPPERPEPAAAETQYLPPPAAEARSAPPPHDAPEPGDSRDDREPGPTTQALHALKSLSTPVPPGAPAPPPQQGRPHRQPARPPVPPPPHPGPARGGHQGRSTGPQRRPGAHRGGDHDPPAYRPGTHRQPPAQHRPQPGPDPEAPHGRRGHHEPYDQGRYLPRGHQAPPERPAPPRHLPPEQPAPPQEPPGGRFPTTGEYERRPGGAHIEPPRPFGPGY